MATVLGLPYEGRSSYWIVGYDDAFGVFSPGRLLLEHVVAGSVANGDVRGDGRPAAVASRPEVLEAA